jgi:hypothetical protein
MTDYWVELAQLGERQRLGWGNAGNSMMWSCRYAGSRFVFKEYSDEFRAAADQNALGGLIGWRDTLDADDRRHLDRIAAWPRYRVRHNNHLLGVLLPFAPEEYFRTAHHDGYGHPNVVANLVGRRTMDGTVVPGSPVELKKSALGSAADVLLWFHQRNVYVNDVRELNILCAEQGSAYFVDCDVMISRWGQVGPVAAPEYLIERLPKNAGLSAGVELARLAWVALWILLEDFSLRDIPLARLTKVVDASDADLIMRTARCQSIRADEWRRLANRWMKVQARARPHGQTPVITPTSFLPPTRTMPEPQRVGSKTRWVPEQYRRPIPTRSAVTEGLEPAQVASGVRGMPIALIGTLVAVVLVLLVVVALVQKGP